MGLRTMKRRHNGSRAAAVLCALLLAVPAGVGAQARLAAVTDAEPVVVVEVEKSIERGEQLAKAVRSEAESGLRAHDVATEVDPASPRKLTISVGGEKFAYRVRLVVERDGVAGEPQELACECTQDELLAKVREGVDAQAEELGAEAVGNPEPVTTSAATDDGSTDPPDEPERVPLGGLGKGGIASLVIGVAALGAGIGLAVVGKREREGDSERDVETTNFGPPGYALIGVGAAAVITGAVLLAVDRKRAKRQTTSLTPWFGRGVVGVAVGRRF
jgi:hypothetical protein